MTSWFCMRCELQGWTFPLLSGKMKMKVDRSLKVAHWNLITSMFSHRNLFYPGTPSKIFMHEVTDFLRENALYNSLNLSLSFRYEPSIMNKRLYCPQCGMKLIWIWSVAKEFPMCLLISFLLFIWNNYHIRRLKRWNKYIRLPFIQIWQLCYKVRYYAE